jgi:exodeoxyribonuclease V alpha subunit
VSARTPLIGEDTATLAPFVEAGVLDASAVHVASVIGRSVGGLDPEVLLGAALAARSPRFGHTCVVIADVAGSIVVDDAALTEVDDLPWPKPRFWATRLSTSPAVYRPGTLRGDVNLPLVWDGTRLYLERYWSFEDRVARDLLRRAAAGGGLADPSPELEAILGELFDYDDSSSPDLQREAVVRSLTRRLTVIAGGPGTGKTRTIALLFAAAHRLASGRRQVLEIALAAPTGKAADRMTESVRANVAATGLHDDAAEAMNAVGATTLHRLLGATGSGRFRYDARNPLPHDLVIVDETSMVSLPLMARLLGAVRPDATLVLVGDPYQLASVEAGAVLGDIVGTASTRSETRPLAADVVLLERVHRFKADSAIAGLADAIRDGDADAALELLANDPSGELAWVDGDDQAGIATLKGEVATNSVAVIMAARSGDGQAALGLASDLKVLCATRLGALGVYRWSDDMEIYAARVLPDAGIGRRWYIGRPIIVTRNDYSNRTFNGDVGIVIASSGQPSVMFVEQEGVRELAPSQLGDVETWWATTIHKSQGSEFRRVIVTLPPSPSPILTRELLYTAVTRAKQQVTLVASEAALRAAITRPAVRASGLGPKLWP